MLTYRACLGLKGSDHIIALQTLSRNHLVGLLIIIFTGFRALVGP
jgi:hypothetical protein